MDTNTKEMKEEEVQEKKQEILQDSVDDKQNDEDVSCNEQGLIDTIIRMYQQYISLETISEFTNLSVEQLQRIVDNNVEVIRQLNEEQRQKEKEENRKVRCEGYIAGGKKGDDDGIEATINLFTKKDVIQRMYEDNLSIEKMSLYTNLTKKQVQKLIGEEGEKDGKL